MYLTLCAIICLFTATIRKRIKEKHEGRTGKKRWAWMEGERDANENIASKKRK